MSFLGNDNSQILVAGGQSVMYRIDVEKGQIIEEVCYICGFSVSILIEC